MKFIAIFIANSAKIFPLFLAETKQLGDDLAEFAAQCNISVNSQAVRFFTSRSSPDTTALCSLLQLNNIKKSNLIDIEAKKHHDKIADEMSKLFINDGLNEIKNLETSKKIFFKNPWDEEGVEKISLVQGKNVFWLKEIPSDEMKIDGNLVRVILEPKLTFDNFYDLLNVKLNFIIDRMKILKVIDTENAKKTVEKIVEYFTRIEEFLSESLEDKFLDPKNFANRTKLIKLNSIKNKKISQFLSTIANDDKVSELNAEQKAAYLRSVDGTSKAGRGLAMRSAKKSKKSTKILTFDETARKEVLEMAENFHEISSLDFKSHKVSFYSQATTFEGIQTLVEFTKDPFFKSFTANEILQVLNIVGIACAGPIGDFPDASSWKVNEMFVGCYLSVADIITSFHQGGDQNALKPPGIDKEITNVIPIFDDPKIGIFLKKFAPSLLEFTSSIGMRRVIADVPMTFGYSIISGIRRIVYEMNKNKSTIHIESFGNLVETAASFVGKYYDHIEELLVDQSSRGLNSYYLANNGLSNLIVPLIRVFKKKKSLDIPELLRSIYSFEIWKGISKDFKGKSNFLDLAKDHLFKLLKIDLEKNKVSQIDPYEEPRTDFYDDFEIDQEFLDKLTQPFYYLNYMTLLPKFLEAVVAGRPEDIKNIPEMSKNSIVEDFGVKFPFKEFLFLNVFQALRFPMKKSRVDTEGKKMKILDLKNREEALSEVKSYVRLQFKQLYEKELKAKQKQEKEIHSKLIVDGITSTSNLTEALKLWKNGISKGKFTFEIKNSSSIGFKMLSNKLLDFKAEIPLRGDLIKVLITGRDAENEIIYNNGEICYVENFKKFKKRFLLTKSIEEWKEIEEKFENRGIHFYRDAKNRHGHDNELRSYFGLGFTTLENYFKSLDEASAAYYCGNHGNCCGDTWHLRWTICHKSDDEEDVESELQEEEEEIEEGV